MHAIWKLPEDDGDCATRWMLIKSCFSRAIPKDEWIRESRRKRDERCLWQRRFWEHWVIDTEDLQRHMDYVHFNPVKHGYAKRAADWPYSSIHRHIRQGWMPDDWAADVNMSAEVGER
jgi:putative transposase